MWSSDAPDLTPSWLSDVIRRRVGLLLLLAGVTASALLAAIAALPDLFRATASVLVERPAAGTIAGSPPGAELESRLEVIKQEVLARDRLSDLITRFDLYPALRDRDGMEAAVTQVRRDIGVAPMGTERIDGATRTVALSLTFKADSAERAAEVANAIASFYVERNSRMRSEETAMAAQFLKAQVDEALTRLDRDERRMQAYTNRHALELPQQVEVNLATLERLNTQLRLNVEQQMRTADARQRWLESPTPAGAPPLSPRAARLEALKMELAQLEGLSERHPDVRRIKGELALLEAGLGPGAREPQPAAADGSPRPAAAATGRSRPADTIEADLTALRAEERALRQTIAGLERRLESVPRRQGEFVVLSRSHQANRDRYEQLAKQYEAAQLAESLERTNQGERFRILESAVPPFAPIAPNRWRLMLGSVLLSIFVALLVVLLVERSDSSFHSVDEIRRFTRVPVLATIPHLARTRRRMLLRGAGFTLLALAACVTAGALSTAMTRESELLARLLVRG